MGDIVKASDLEKMIMVRGESAAAQKGGRFSTENNLKGATTIKLPAIKILHGADTFTFPTAGEKDLKLEEFTGVLIDDKNFRVYYKKSIEESEGEITLPDCFSMNGIHPEQNSIEMQNDSCAGCKWDEWGSDPKGKKGKACREMRLLHVLVPSQSNLIPYRFLVPTTSIENWDNFKVMITSRDISRFACFIKFSLTGKKEGQREWSIVNFSVVEAIKNIETLDRLETIYEQIRASITSPSELFVDEDEVE